jgi:hypothetical protein
MVFPEQLSPAFMLFREKGDLLFANSGASELTGFEGARHLEDWLARLFPHNADSELVNGMIRRASNKPLGPEPIRFMSDFSTASGLRRRGAFQLHLWQEEFSGRRLLVSILPCRESKEASNLSQETWSGLMEQVQDRLNEALDCLQDHQADGDQESLGRLGQILVHSRNLLAAAKGLDRSWSRRPQSPEKPVIPTRGKIPETRVNI